MEKLESFMYKYEQEKHTKKKSSWIKNIISYISRPKSREYTATKRSSPVENIEDWVNPLYNKY